MSENECLTVSGKRKAPFRESTQAKTGEKIIAIKKPSSAQSHSTLLQKLLFALAIVFCFLAPFIFLGFPHLSQQNTASSAAPAPLPPPAEQQDATLPLSTADRITPEIEEGYQARQQWEKWIGHLRGEKRRGALYWMSIRSKPDEHSCDGSKDFALACFEARRRISVIDARRKTDSDFDEGWNMPTAR